MPIDIKNYYSILGLNSFESNQNAIKSAYNKETAKFHPQSYSGEDLVDRLVEINEAFLILSDENVKPIYDKALSGNLDINKGYLNSVIQDKREKAKKFISSFFNGTQKRKVSLWKRIWKTIGIIFLCLFVLGSIGRIVATCTQQNYSNEDADAVNLGTFIPPSNWNYYKIDGSFSLSVPPTLELRSEYDKYTQFLSAHQLEVSNAGVVFQQKELGNMSSEAMSTYCRIMAERYYVGTDYVERYNESPKLTTEDFKILRDLADAELPPWKYINQPSYRWVKANGYNAIEISYTRDGANGEVVCHIYLFCNYTEMVKIITSYRKVDEETWKKDINDVIKTFKWLNPR